MVSNLKINESDFTLCRKNLREFLERSGSPFEDYNFSTSILGGLLDFGAYLLHFLSYQMNKSLEEIFLDTATLEDNVYSLLKNYNYIPKLRKPANSFLRTRYFRNYILQRLTVADETGFQQGEIITGSTSSATAIIDSIDAGNNYIYIKSVTGTFQTSETITGSTTASTTTISAIVTSDSVDDTLDANDADDSATFEMRFNEMKYDTAGNYLIIPTYRDKLQADYYDDVDVNDFLTTNIANFAMTPYIDSTNGIRYLQAKLPIYQGQWTAIEETVAADFDGEILLSDSTGTSYEDKVIIDTIRVKVKEGSEWYDYEDIRSGIFDENQRNYVLEFDPTETTGGVKIKFNTQYVSKTQDIGNIIRIFFVVTEGDDINEVDGSNTWTDASVFNDITIVKTSVDPTVTILDSADYGTTVSTGTSTYCTSALLDSLDDSATADYLDNGTARQTVASIKETATGHYSTQGRCVTENDYNVVLRKYFTEFSDIYAWGGEREFLDIQDIVDEEFTDLGITSATQAQVRTIIYNTLQRIHTESDVSIESVSTSDITAGKFVRDVGHVYFSAYYPNYTFITETSDINAIKAYLDDKKFHSIFLKYRTPTFTELKLSMTLEIEKAYTKTISSITLKQRILDYLTEKSGFEYIFKADTLRDEIRSYDEVASVNELTYRADLRAKRDSDSQDVYVRIYTGIEDLDTNIVFDDPATTTYTITSSGGLVYINSELCGTINTTLGLIRLNHDFDSTYGISYDSFTIQDVNFTGTKKVTGAKDNVVCVKNITDISMSLL